MSDTGKNIKVELQRYLPQHLLSRAAGKLAECEWVWLKSFLIDSFIRKFSVDLSEAECSDPAVYRSFNHFFTRKLKSGARPLDEQSLWVVPVDGYISSVQAIQSDTLIQAKGKQFSLSALLADPAIAQLFFQGWSTVFYLAPHNYHRVHMPVDGTLVKSIYVPGDLFSVNSETALEVDQLFSKNERLVLLFDTAFGSMALVLVGAFFVGSMKSVWREEAYKARTLLIEEHSKSFKKGEELAYFQMGSTAIVLSANPEMKPVSDLLPESAVRFGESFVPL